MLHGMHTAHRRRVPWPGWHGGPVGLRAGAAGCGLVAIAALAAGPAAGVLAAAACVLAAALAWPVSACAPLTIAPAPTRVTPARPRRTRPHGPDLATLAGRSWMALETAQAAVRAATPYLDAQETAERSHRLVEERKRTIRQLQGLADDEHADAPLLHWLAAPGTHAACSACRTEWWPASSTSTACSPPARHACRSPGPRPSTRSCWSGPSAATASSSPSTGAPSTRSTSPAGLASKVSGAFWAAAESAFPKATPTTPPAPRPCTRWPNRKNQVLQQHLDRQGVAAFSGSRFYLEAARSIGVHRAVVSASANTAGILESAGLAHLIEYSVDGNTIASEHLRSKPAPDTLIAACRRLGVQPGQLAAFETTLPGSRPPGRRVSGSPSASTAAARLTALLAGDADLVISDLVGLVRKPALGSTARRGAGRRERRAVGYRGAVGDAARAAVGGCCRAGLRHI